MSPTHNPTGYASIYASQPPTDHMVDIDESEDEESEDDESDASSEVSDGGDLRDDLEDAFAGDFDFRGSFTFSETFTSTPPPGLYIEGIGVIGFPLSKRDAKLIEAAATQAPFGKGTETVVDKAVRDTFEINPDRFSFTNPAWTQFLRTVTKKVADGLGLPPNRPLPNAESYKLLLYKTGSHFLPHKDTEKSPGMFASLIIVLPSKFEGGEVHVSHGGSMDVFNISPSSQFTTSALAWYTDATHEVKPVTSGYRLAISYNLVNTSPGLPPFRIPDTHSAVSVVENIFHKWKKEVYYDEPELIAYMLDHKYSGASLEFTALKGKDASLISSIRGVAEKHGVSLHIGLLECEMHGGSNVYGPYDSEDEWAVPPKMEEVDETEYRIKSLYDLEGDLAEGGKPMELDPESEMIPQDPGFEDQDPDQKEFQGYTGNEGPPMKYWYRRSVLVMSLGGEYPMTRMLDMGGANYALRKLKRWEAEGPTERNRSVARFLAGYHISPECRSMLINLAFEWDDLVLWDKVHQTHSSGEHLTPDFAVRAWSVFTFDRTKPTIEKVIHGHDTRAALQFIRALQARVPVQDQQGVKAWLGHQVTAVLSSITKPPSVGDVEMFIGIAESEGLLFFSQTIVRQLVGFHQMFGFWVGLAEGLWKNRHRLLPPGGAPEEAPTYTTALNHTLDSLIAAAVPEYYSGIIYDRYAYATFGYTESEDHTRIQRLLDLMVLTHRTQKLGQLIALVSQLQGNLFVEYRRLIIPLIPKLSARYRQYDRSDFPVLDAFLRALVERWLQDLLGTPSKKPKALVKRLFCECKDCARVNRFLQSSAMTETFRPAQKRRSHVEANLRSTLPDDVTFTTIVRGSPYGLQVTKTNTMDKWSGRVESTRALLALVGTPEELVRIMGDRYQDLQAALAGTKPYKIGSPAPVVAPVEGPPVASTSTAAATRSGTRTGPVVAGVKRKAEDDGDVIDLT